MNKNLSHVCISETDAKYLIPEGRYIIKYDYLQPFKLCGVIQFRSIICMSE